MALPTKEQDDPAERAPFMAFAEDEATRATLTRAAEAMGWPTDRVFEGGSKDAARALSGLATPRLVVVDLGASTDPVTELELLSEVCDPGTAVIALGSVNDVPLYRRLIAMGVGDYLVKPVDAAALGDAFRAVTEKPAAAAASADIQSEPERAGRLIVVIGARGGVGASSVALNAAWMTAHEQGLRTALVDLDIYFGTAALALDLEPGRGFREALENPDRMDGLFIERAMIRESDNLFILAAEEQLDKPVRLDPSALERLFERLRGGFDCVIADMPRALAAGSGGLLAMADEIVLVSDLSLAGMRDAMRLAGYLKPVAPRAGVRVVVNRAGQMKSGEIGRKDFEQGIQRPVDLVLPFDVRPMAESAGTGKAAAEIARHAKFVDALRPLVRTMSGGKVDEAPGGGLAGLLSLDFLSRGKKKE